MLATAGGCNAPAPTPSPSPTPRPTGGLLRVGLDFHDYEQYQRLDEVGFDGSWDPTTTWAVAPFMVFLDVRHQGRRPLRAADGR
jgi:hypothetical protein